MPEEEEEEEEETLPPLRVLDSKTILFIIITPLALFFIFDMRFYYHDD